jgi:choline dehydrogenase
MRQSDHISVASMAKIPERDSMHRLFNIRYALVEGLKYIFLKTGQLTQPFTTVNAYLHSDRVSEEGKILPRPDHEKEPTLESPSEIIPDLEIMPIPVQGNDELKVAPGIGVFTWMVLLNKPKSRGTVRLASADPRDYPLVDLNFFGDAHDLVIARKGVRLTMHLFAEMRKQGYKFEEWLCPEPDSNDAQLDEFIRANARAGLHQSSTCRMAPESDSSPGVVDDELRVHGIRNLRICDASIFPEIISAHLMAPAVMTAEKCAHMIKNSA